MDPVIIGAIVVGGFSVVAASIGAIATLLAIRKRTSVEREAEDVSQSTQDALKEAVLYQADSVLSKMVMANLEGLTEVTREFKGMKVIPSGVTVEYIPGRFWADHPSGRIVTGPTLENATLAMKDVSLRVVNPSDKEADYNIEITGGLTDNDAAFDYQVGIVFSAGMYITREEVEVAYRDAEFKREFHSFDVRFPLNVLELKVVFPDGYEISCYPMVFHFDSERTIITEVEKLTSGFTENPNGAKFRVAQPRVGFRYAIFWVSPTQDRVDALRESG